MANISVIVQDANNIVLEVTPTPSQTINVDRGVTGNGIESITIVTIDGDQYLHILFTNGSTSDVGPISATSYTGVTPIVVNNTTNQISLDTVPVSSGGTGSTTASSARTNLGLGSAAVLTAGAALGVATLDAGGTVPLSQIPASIQGGVSYQGAWNATTNSPTLTSGVGTKGYYYVVSTAGSTDLDGITNWNIGDWAIFNGTIWQKIDNTDAVTSVNGYTGTVVLTASDVGALASVTSTDGSITVSQVGTAVDLAVSAASPASTLLLQVRNNSGATMTKGTVVYVNGAVGQLPTIAKALATSDATSAQTQGLVTANIANNSNGYVTIIGLVNDIDTSAYTDGEQLYLSGVTAGAMTATKQYAPIHLVYVGVVIHAHPTQGKIQVKVQNGYELDELHNVSAQSPANGNTLVYNSSNSLWEASSTFPVNPTFSGGTANGVAYLNGSKVLTTGSALVFDGTNLGLGVTPSAWGSGRPTLEFGGSTQPAIAFNGNATNGGSVWTNSYFNGSANVYKANGYATRFDTSNSGAFGWFQAASGTAGATATFTQAMTLDASGNLLVGTMTLGGTGSVRGLTIGGGGYESLGATYDYAGAVYRYNSINENGWVWWNERSIGGPVQEFFVTSSFTKVGNINCTTTATNYVTSSDYRLKENIQPMTGALAKVAALKPCTYTWKVDGSSGQGFIAHELAEVVPQCVSGEKDAVDENGKIDPQGIDTSFLVATLTAAIQEQQALITTLTERITALEQA